MKFNVLWIAGLMLAATAGQAQAGLVTFTQVFDSGFSVSINGGPTTLSGPITIVGIVDDTAADLDPGFNGEFALLSLTFTGAGFVNEAVLNPMSLLVWGTDKFAFQRLGEFNEGITGWNGSTASGDFITDRGDLTTLFGLPYTTTGTSTFWFDGLGVNQWSLASGDTIGANLGGGGPNGTFSISASSSAVPEPSSIAMFGMGAIGVVLAARKRRQTKLAA